MDMNNYYSKSSDLNQSFFFFSAENPNKMVPISMKFLKDILVELLEKISGGGLLEVLFFIVGVIAVIKLSPYRGQASSS